MRQERQSRAQKAFVPQLAQEKIDRQRQLRRGQHFLANRCQNLLCRNLLRQPLAQSAKEVALLDVFLAAERGEGRKLWGGAHACCSFMILPGASHPPASPL